MSGEPPSWGDEMSPPLPGRAVVALALPGAALVAAAAALSPVAAVIAACLYGAGAWLWIAAQGHRALRALGAVRLDDGSAPRLANIVAGLAADLGMAPPTLWAIPSGGPNGLVCRARGPCLAVTRALLEDYTRTEHEAVAAHCLLRLRRSRLGREALAVALGRLGPAPVVTSADDVRAAALTRYPPALASAIARADARRRFGAFWFVAEPPSHEPARARLSQLESL